MEPATRQWGERRLARVLAGLQAGILGGLAMLALYAATSAVHHESIWKIPNLLGSTFYGPAAIRPGSRSATVAGIALQLFIAGGIGSVFGLLPIRKLTRARLTVLGAATGMVWYWIAMGLVWRRVNPLFLAYAPTLSLYAGHLLYGFCLGVSGRLLSSLERTFEPAPEEPAAP